MNINVNYFWLNITNSTSPSFYSGYIDCDCYDTLKISINLANTAATTEIRLTWKDYNQSILFSESLIQPITTTSTVYYITTPIKGASVQVSLPSVTIGGSTVYSLQTILSKIGAGLTTQ